MTILRQEIVGDLQAVESERRAQASSDLLQESIADSPWSEKRDPMEGSR